MSVVESTVAGARLQLDVNSQSKIGQVLTSATGMTPFAAQTSATQPMAAATQVVEFNHSTYLTDGQQTFIATVPDDLHYLSRLTLVVGVPAIANQTQNQVNKSGVSGGVSSLAFGGDATGYNGTTFNISIAAPDTAGGVTATATAARVPAGAVATAAGVDFTITNPGWGYTSAPTVTPSGTGATSMADSTTTATITSTTTGENYRYVVPSKPSGQQQAALSATDSNSGTATNLGTALLVESDVSKVHGIVAKSIAGLTFPSAVDGVYHNSIDGGVQDIAPYFMPYCAHMMIEEATLSAGALEIARTDGFCLLNKTQVYTPEGQQLRQQAHAAADPQVLKAWSVQADNRWYVDLDFFPQEKPFPLAAAAKTALHLKVKTKAWPSMIINGSGGGFVGQCEITTSGTVVKTVTVAPATDTAASYLSSTAPATTALGTAVAKTDFSLLLLASGYLVSEAAKTAMQTAYHRIPVTRHFVTNSVAPLTDASVKQRIKLNVRLPVKAVHWVGYLESNRLRNDLSNFAGPGDPVTATAAHPQGLVPRPLFDKCQLFVNNKPVTLLAGADHFVHQAQKDHGLRRPDRPLHIWSHHFCVGSPYDFQHDAYLDATETKYFELRVNPDPAIFADNTAVLGLNGSTSGTPTVAGGQQLHVRIWCECQDYIVVENGTVRLAYA
jgi:hypothetical protein